MRISCPDFKHNGAIPNKFTAKGVDVNPAIYIEDVPKGVKTLALIVDDPDAYGRCFVHFVLFNIPVVNKIEENSAPGTVGINDFGKENYGGPNPPSGTHRYFFKIYALDITLPLQKGASKAEVEKAMKGHILAKAEIIGLFSHIPNGIQKSVLD